MKEDFVSQFDGLLNAIQGLQGELKAVMVHVTEAEDRISTNQDDIASLLTQNTTTRKAIDELVLKVDNLENRSCRSNLCLVGLPEGKEGTDMVCFWRSGYLMCLVQLTFLGHRAQDWKSYRSWGAFGGTTQSDDNEVPKLRGKDQSLRE